MFTTMNTHRHKCQPPCVTALEGQTLLYRMKLDSYKTISRSESRRPNSGFCLYFLLQAYERRFPTCHLIPMFVASDVVNEENSEDGATHRIERRCALDVDAPRLLKRVRPASDLHFTHCAYCSSSSGRDEALELHPLILGSNKHLDYNSDEMIVKCDFLYCTNNADMMKLERNTKLEPARR